MKTPEQLIETMKHEMENIALLAHTFGPSGATDSVNRGRFALAALQTIQNIATSVMVGL